MKEYIGLLSDWLDFFFSSWSSEESEASCSYRLEEKIDTKTVTKYFFSVSDGMFKVMLITTFLFKWEIFPARSDRKFGRFLQTSSFSV